MRDRQEGASAIEFAVVLPVLIMLLFGIIAFGIAFAQELSLSNAARQGARYAAVPGLDGVSRTCSEVQDHVRDAVATVGLEPADVTVTITRGPDEASAALATSPCTEPQVCENSVAGDNVYVEARADYTLTIPLVMDGTRQLSGLGAFRCEYS